MSAATLPSKSKSSGRRGSWKARAEQLLRHEIDFIHNPEFEHDDAAEVCLACDDSGRFPDDETSRRMPKRPSNVPAYFASLYETPLLTPDEERRAFRKLNYAKFRANALRSRLDPGRPDRRLVREIESLLRTAGRVRNALVKANLRLVVSVARRFVDGNNRFDDLVSDGNLTLVHAIEKFDYGRGFRFSTYATHAIQRTFYRGVTRRRKDATRVVATDVEILNEVVESREAEDVAPSNVNLLRRLFASMDEALDDREQYILKARFGLDETEPQTLQVLADQLGVCKERVRQLQLRAVDKLRELADRLELSPADLVPATV